LCHDRESEKMVCKIISHRKKYYGILLHESLFTKKIKGH